MFTVKPSLPLLTSAAFLIATSSLHASFTISKNGKPRCIIVTQPGAPEPEQSALHELTNTLHQITSAEFQVTNALPKSSDPSIIIGPGPLAEKEFPEINFASLGPEELIMRVKGKTLLLAGGRPRGTIYAVDRFLSQQCGVRWWTPWATNIPQKPTLQIANPHIREKPAFEYRGPYWYPGFEAHWKVHNGANDQTWAIPKELGGCILYKGFAHTFYPLVPPEKHFAEHPEWYSLIKGKRSHERAQLCLTNPQLRDFAVQRVREWLRESPDAQIISVTQNDWAGWCECPDCKALDDAEGSHSGTMLSFVNYIAEKIGPEFPQVAVDTFAYQFTRKPPKTLHPLPNVIVRLCSIECNFREPLDHPSNASFMTDLHGWSKICSRLYVWDYSTDFRNYIHPHPNWFVLGPDVRIFQSHNVKGLFSEGAYAGYGSEFAELRAWVLAQLMWNPQQDDRALIKEFLEGYYGKPAAKPISEYLHLMHDASKGFYLGCFFGKEQAPHLTFNVLGSAERLWQQAEDAARPDSEKLARVRVSHLPVRYAFLRYWSRLKHECWEQNLTWPFPESRKAAAEEFRTVCQGIPGKDWTHVRVLNERGQTVDDFLKDFAQDPPDKDGPPPPARLKKRPRPSGLEGVSSADWIDLQDNLAGLYQPGKFAQIRLDNAASDLRAVWMPGDHHEWAFRIHGEKLPAAALHGRWKLYASIRTDKLSDCKPDSIAFSAGVRDNQKNSDPASVQFKANETDGSYHSYLVGTVELNTNRDLWVAPASNPGIKAIWVDRMFLLREANQ